MRCFQSPMAVDDRVGEEGHTCYSPHCTIPLLVTLSHLLHPFHFHPSFHTLPLMDDPFIIFSSSYVYALSFSSTVPPYRNRHFSFGSTLSRTWYDRDTGTHQRYRNLGRRPAVVAQPIAAAGVDLAFVPFCFSHRAGPSELSGLVL
jgi:hypothetical protein